MSLCNFLLTFLVSAIVAFIIVVTYLEFQRKRRMERMDTINRIWMEQVLSKIGESGGEDAKH